MSSAQQYPTSDDAPLVSHGAPVYHSTAKARGYMMASPTNEPDQDTALIAACDEFAALRFECDDIIEDYDDHPPGSAEALAIEARAAPLEARMETLEALVTETRARTLEGIKAKARALEALDIEHYDGDDFRELLASLLTDLKALRR